MLQELFAKLTSVPLWIGNVIATIVPLQIILRGKDIGQFFTPRDIVDLMVEMSGLKVSVNQNDSVLDACCGSGGFLIASMRDMLSKASCLVGIADKSYREHLSSSRNGFAITPEELERLNNIVSPLIKNGQSIHHIYMSNADELMCSEKTIYNLLNASAFDADRLDCPRIVRMRPRKTEPNKKIDRRCYDGRTYEDYMQFIADNPDVPVVQMDTVIGRKGGKVLLTVFFSNCNLLLGFLRDSNTARSVQNTFDELYAILGREAYCELFPVILTDRGTEFSNPTTLERDKDGELRSLVFYCDPSAPYQKGGIEVAHELIRRILPKGTSFDDLQQEDIDLMLSHINSYKRGKLNSRSANQLFSFIYGDDILPKLNIREIEPNDIVMSPKLLRK